MAAPTDPSADGLGLSAIQNGSRPVDPLETRFFVQSFVRFLNTETASASFAPDVVESLEVAIQCLETAYNLPVAVPFEGMLAADPKQHLEVRELFREACAGSAERRSEAEQLKAEANRLMRAQQFGEALGKYDRAIYLDPTNPTYYCNRAAIHTQLNNNAAVVADCRRALRYDPRYAKAYGRLGIALARLGQLAEARQAYQSAQNLDPENADYYNNFLVVEARLAEQEQAAAAAADLAASAGRVAASTAAAAPGSSLPRPNSMGRTAQRSAPAAPAMLPRPAPNTDIAALPIIAQMLQNATGGGGGSPVERLQQQLGPLLRSVRQSTTAEVPSEAAASSLPPALGGASQLAVQMSQLIQQLSEAVADPAAAADSGQIEGGAAGIGGLLGLLSGLDGFGGLGAAAEAVAGAAAATAGTTGINQAQPRQP